MIVINIMMKIITKYNSIKKIVTGAPNAIQHLNNAHPNTSPIDCDGVLLTIAQCHMVLISIPWHREYWTIQLKAHLKPDSIKSSNTPAWPNQLLVWMSLSGFILISKNAAIMCGMFIINGVHSQNQGRQEETHHPTHRFRRLFLDLLLVVCRGCASATGVIKSPILLF